MAPKTRISSVIKSENKQLFETLESKKRAISKKLIPQENKKQKKEIQKIVKKKIIKRSEKTKKIKVSEYENNINSFSRYVYKRNVDINKISEVKKFNRPREARTVSLEERAQLLRLQIDAIDDKIYRQKLNEKLEW